MAFLDKTGLARLWQNILALVNDKVPNTRTVNGKSLTENITLSANDVGADVSGAASNVQSNLDVVSDELDAHTSNSNIHFTSTERTKLTGIETGAQKNTITGVKGNSESSYRTGNVNITAANIGLGNVNNTSDANKPVSTAQQTAIDTALASAKSYTDTKTSGMATTSSVNTSISTHNTSTTAHNDIRELINDLSTAVNNFLDVDDTTTDQLSEVLTLINNNKGTLESLTSSKINVSDIVNNLTTNSSSKVLSAAQGVTLKGLIDALEEAVDSKADSEHTHAISDVTDLQTTLDGKAASSHTHSASEITAGTLNGSLTIGSGKVLDFVTKSGKFRIMGGGSTDTASIRLVDSGNHVIEDILQVDVNTGEIVGGNLKTAIDGKADSSTTLAGYGITDAYTKTEVDTAIANNTPTNSRNTWYGTCPTAASTTAKVVTTSSGDFKLETGSVVYVTFTYQAVASATLNVDGTGAKNIKTVGTTNVAAYYWAANETIGFVYDGTYFRMLDGQTATTTYYGMTKLSSSTSSTATNVAATPSAVKSAYDLANAAMPKSGGAFTGTVTLAADPTENLGAATKQYVDNAITSALMEVENGTY